jgi:hypothetical protein
MVKKVIHNAQKARINDPYDVLALAIFDEAVNEAQIVLDYLREFGSDALEKKNHDSHEKAIWIGEWLYKNTKGGKK